MHKDFIFFQQAVLSIIGDLDFNKSLLSSFRFLKKYFPLEAITIDQYSPEKKGISILALVNDSGVLNMRHFIPLSAGANIYMGKRSLSRIILNIANGELLPISKEHGREIQSVVPSKPRGYLVGPLTSGNMWMADLVFIGSRPNCFTPRHEDLMGMLLAPFSLAINNRLHLTSLIASKKQSDEERDRLRKELRDLSIPPVVGENGGLREVMDSVLQLEGKDTSVLLMGETGTGKEVIANAIQRRSRRRDSRFIRVNCGALPETLVDSELFGYEKGSFTGAESLRIGRFEQANGGTLFLDEVGELTLSAQVRLLRVLQDGMVERIGSIRSTPVDVRIIAATNRDLSRMRRQGTFREDLFHRLNIFPIRIPPLRERLEDLPELVHYFVERIARRMEISPPPEVSPESLERARFYHWPGNIRELENIVERAMILNPAGPLDIGTDLPYCDTTQDNTCCGHATPHEKASLDEKAIRELIDERIATALAKLQPTTENNPCLDSGKFHLDEAMSTLIRKVLTTCNGKISGPGGAAEALGINHSTLRNRMKKMGIAVRGGKIEPVKVM